MRTTFQATAIATAIAATLLLGAGAASASVNLITFEEAGLVAMPNAQGSGVSAGAQLHDQFLATLGASFSSGANYVAVVDHGFPLLTPTPPNIIGGTNANGALDYSAVIRVAFYDPTNTGNQATTDHVKVLGDLFGAGGGSVTMNAFDRFGGFLGSVTDLDNKPLGQGPVLELNIAGIQSVTFSGTSGTVGFDNFEFNTVRPTGAAVPEPAAWALMIAGFGLTGAALRRRRTPVTA
ncbi:PEPxxWA-CTERM sorting domain-containing protein [Phenylobacterium sp.]|uniref:PEPxxWA-CTERM sorting domain-containing protein n=1 Tax=Phenylobacterium sp. TaxID=1871053 RepID=UPI00374CE845